MNKAKKDDEKEEVKESKVVDDEDNKNLRKRK